MLARSLLSLAILSGLVQPPLAAQATPMPRLVGWTNAPLLPASGNVDIQDVDSCQPARRLCGGVLLHHGLAYAGGTAYEPRHHSVWSSDGRMLEERNVDDCRVLCSVQAALMNDKAVVSGLAIGDARRTLWHLETTPGYLGILPWDNARCPPIPTKGGCTMQLAPNEIAAGLAYDESTDLLFFTISRPALIGWSSTLLVADASNRCAPLCKIELKPCQLDWGHVTGLAFEACRQRLWATDGRTTLWLDFGDARRCEVKIGTCCAKQFGSAWAGLDVIPLFATEERGKSCLPKGCPFCQQMRAALSGGVPSLGNRDFGLDIVDGPVGRLAILALGGGACTDGLAVPVLCGLFYPRLDTLVLLPPLSLAGAGACDGAGRVPLAVPVDRGLCGLVLCAQWLVLCGPQLGVTQGIRFHIASS